MINNKNIVDFLNDIGIDALIEDLTEREMLNCFLPGVLLNKGSLKIDRSALAGDILHEAGHLAIFPNRIRPYCSQPTISNGEAMIYVLEAHGVEPSEKELDALQYCYDDQAPQGWQFAANIELGLPTDTGFDLRFTDREGIDIHNSIKASIGDRMGHRTSVTLYYLGMIQSKQSFPNMLKWTNDVS